MNKLFLVKLDLVWYIRSKLLFSELNLEYVPLLLTHTHTHTHTRVYRPKKYHKIRYCATQCWKSFLFIIYPQLNYVTKLIKINARKREIGNNAMVTQEGH